MGDTATQTIKIMPCSDMKEGRGGKGVHFVDPKDARDPEAVVEGGAQILLAASVFHYRTFSIKAVKEYLKEKGLQINL